MVFMINWDLNVDLQSYDISLDQCISGSPLAHFAISSLLKCSSLPSSLLSCPRKMILLPFIKKIKTSGGNFLNLLLLLKKKRTNPFTSGPSRIP